MKQILCERSAFQSLPGGASYSGFPGPFGGRGPEIQAQTAWMVDGTFRNFAVALDAAPGAGSSWSFEIYKNGAATGLVVTIADTATEGLDTTHSFAISAGDRLACLITPSGSPVTTGGIAYSCEFESDNARESGYAYALSSFPDSVNPRKNGVFWCCNQSSSMDTWNNTNTADEIGNILPTDGAITGTSMLLNASPGGGSKAFTCVLYKALAASPTSFTKQDGSGGTVDTRVTCSGATTANRATFSLPVAAGDRVYYEVTPENTPDSLGLAISIGTRFLADVDGESIIGGWMKTALNTGAARFFAPHGLHDSYDATEGIWELRGNPTAFALSRLHARLSAAPSSGKSWEFLIRKNGATPAGTLAVTITDTAVGGSDLTHSVGISGL